MSIHQHSINYGELIIDLFAGGGGASTGIEISTGRSPDIAINHDGEALALHCANHPDTLHYQEDVFERCPSVVTGGAQVGLLWFSPTCTHFSKAKGGKLLNTKIRSLAWVGVRWARVAKPRVMVMENVEEFEGWGPLIDGKPDPDKKGVMFDHFVRQLRRYGYTVDWQQLKAHEHGAPTTRKRLFLVARRDGCQVQWPTATHGDGLKPYRTAAECIDWSIPCPSIFTRKKPLADATLARVARGLKRFVIDNPAPFVVPDTGSAWILRHFGTSTGHKVDEPLRTITADGGGKSVLLTAFLAKHYGGVTGHVVDRPLGTVTTVDHHSLVTGVITPIDNRSSGRLIGNAVDDPLRTIVTENRFALTQAFLVKYYGSNFALPVDEPLRTITTRDRFGLVTVHGIDYQIADIGLRMLQPRELYTAQGFPEKYIIDTPVNGKRMTKKAQVRMVGNSVSPPPAAALVSANYQHQSEIRAA